MSEPKETTFYCARCGTSKDLYSLEQKNLDHGTIGVIFVCGKCSDKLTGRSLEISFGDTVDTTGHEHDFTEIMNEELTGYEIWN